MRELKRSKPAGEDGEVAEMLQATGEFGVKNTTELANNICIILEKS